MSIALARVLGPEIRAVCVAPGFVNTGFAPRRTQEMMDEADDVALAVMACITHLRHTTGSVIAVNAGRHL
jgi:3-oxoacyl-[acyl-carrier protein] reductase